MQQQRPQPRRAEFIRQQWRMWIETSTAPGIRDSPASNSFASNGECGLKHLTPQEERLLRGNSFASNGECGLKQDMGKEPQTVVINSFASNGECGLKRGVTSVPLYAESNSFASNGECGLKPPAGSDEPHHHRIHSPAMANVD